MILELLDQKAAAAQIVREQRAAVVREKQQLRQAERAVVLEMYLRLRKRGYELAVRTSSSITSDVRTNSTGMVVLSPYSYYEGHLGPDARVSVGADAAIYVETTLLQLADELGIDVPADVREVWS
jgi:hypothetical protein